MNRAVVAQLGQYRQYFATTQAIHIPIQIKEFGIMSIIFKMDGILYRMKKCNQPMELLREFYVDDVGLMIMVIIYAINH